MTMQAAIATVSLSGAHFATDDLEAKTDLPADLIDRLKAGNILHDREDGSEYRQVYVQSAAERFFFESVERRGYKGFGALIRLASQTGLAARAAHM
jgi:4-hydroxyphenylpyruvate dioxygenase